MTIKKILWGTFIFVLLMAALILACNLVQDSDNNKNLPLERPLSARPTAASSTGNLIVRDKYSDGTNNFYLVDVGYISDMYVATLEAVEYTGQVIDIEKTITTTTIDTTSMTKTVSESVTISDTQTHKAGIDVGWKNKFPVAGEFSVKLHYEWTGAWTNSSTNTETLSNTQSTVKQYAESRKVSYHFASDDSRPQGKYRYALYSTCDVYFVVQTSRDNQTLLGWDTVVNARPNDYIVRSEYTPLNTNFTNEPVGTIDFAEDFYKGLGQIAVTPPESAKSGMIEVNVGSPFMVNDWYRTGWHKIPLDLAKLKASGCTKVSFKWETWWLENDGSPDCRARVVLDCAADSNGTRNDDWFYYNMVQNPGYGNGSFHQASWDFLAPIDLVIQRPYIRFAYGYEKHEKNSWYKLTDNIVLTITATK